MTDASLLIIIVSYRTAELAVEAVTALEVEMLGRGRAHVVIIDNCSEDGSLETIGAALKERGFNTWCTLIPEASNRGFAAGNNAGIRWYQREHSGRLPEYVWLLNPDTIAQAGAMDGLVRFLEASPKAGIAGSRMLTPSGDIASNAFRFPCATGEFIGAVNFGPVTRLLGNQGRELPPCDRSIRADWVCGASFMIRRAVLEQIGMLDEGYFLYFEETDYCARAADAGFETWAVAESRVVHLEGQSTGVTGGERGQKRRPRYWFVSRARFFLRRYGWIRTNLANFIWLGGYPVGRLLARIRGHSLNDPPFFWRDFLLTNYGVGGIMYGSLE